jgi:thiosulfate/3-mercaptopyruvate sulfurtransferase
VTEAESTAPKRCDDLLVTPGWLAGHLYDPGLRVVEVAVGRAAYDDWHVDGAVLWDVYKDLKDDEYRLIDKANVQRLLERSGIRPEATVVFYGYAPALGVWLLTLWGHASTRVLDCSRDHWRAAGHPWSNQRAQPTTCMYDLGDEYPHIRADRSAVQAAIGRAGTAVLDVRTAAEYRGGSFWPSGGMEPGGRPGHVPSALHQPLAGLYNDDGSFRSVEDLRAVFTSTDLGKDAEIITYSTMGGRAATAWFVLSHLLGYRNVKVYAGSWAEWGRLSGTPIEVP